VSNSETENINQVNYELPRLGRFKWIVSILSVFILSIFLYFPISDKVNGMVKGLLASNPSCAISYEDISFSLFLPKFIIHDLNIPGNCLGRGRKGIFLSETYLNIRGLSFTPFGPHFLLETELFKNKIEAYFTVGFGAFALNLQEAKLNLKNFKELIPMIKLEGEVTVDAFVEFDKNGIN
jgi:hypothetical protein